MSSLTEETTKKKSIAEIADEEESDAVKKERLKIQIRSLKLLITQIECNLNLTRFEDLRADEKSLTLGTTTPADYRELANVEAIFQNELCSYAGFSCKKFDDKVSVAFQSLHKNLRGNNYRIELSKNEEGWHLGPWIMPMGIDVEAIFDEYSMSTSANIKTFLTDCKHRVDCHNRREEQYKRLEVFMSHMQRYGCSLETNYGYTNVTMKLILKKLVASSNDTKKIIVYFVSANDAVLISRILIDCDGDDELSNERRKYFTTMFNLFKKMDWVDAAQQILTSPDSPFIWKDASNDCSIVEIDADEENDMDSSFSRLLKKKPKVAKKVRSGKSEDFDGNSNDTRERDSNIDLIDVSDDDAAAQVVELKNKKRRLETTNNVVPAEKIFTRKIAAAAWTKNRENTPAAKISDKPKTPRASAKEFFPLKDRNQNVTSSYLKNSVIETAEKSSKITDKHKLASSKFFKSNQKAKGATPVCDKKSAKKGKPITDVDELERVMKKSRSNSKVSSSTPKSRSTDMLPCSTPKNRGVSALSAVAEENISAILRETATTSKRAVDADESIDEESDDLSLKYLSEMCNDRDALLKDLQAVKYDKNKKSTGKATKSPKQIMKAPSRRRKKVSKK